ncbi:molybdopterin molybdotransferase MoeA [Pseudarthrobacter sp. J1738]|uniref:molybdopterin molybdotransferase MoeA n=1 Tax=Pseudarthrobacter sp. J1738 TaxID=3420446 RepID=UPI003D28AC2F
MRTVLEHSTAVLELLSSLPNKLGTQQLPLVQALGRALANDVHAPVSLPPFDNSQMDGYAIRAADLGPDGGPLPLVATIAAGTAASDLPAGYAAPIMTGAMMPPGADAVIPVEAAAPNTFDFLNGTNEGLTVSLPPVTRGAFVRERGGDILAGDVALRAGTALGAAQLGLLAGLGIATVEVTTLPTALLLATGDEVVQPGGELNAGQIFDANSTLLAASMEAAGVKVIQLRASADNPDALRAHLDEALDGVELIVTSGGISKGAFEVVRQAMAGDSAVVDFVSVAMQPGGPQGLGTYRGVPLLAFPGNPVSSLLSFEMFLRPALTSLFGSPAPRPVVRAKLREPLSSPRAKHQLRRAVLHADGTVEVMGGPGSHLLSAAAASNAVVHVPVDVQELKTGADVEVWML